MKIAIVHDYIKEFGGAERVLLALSEIWPDAPIYTSFAQKGVLLEKLKGKDIRVSWAHYIPGFAKFLYSPLRFLAPLIWGSFVRKLTDYDVVITSSSGYITKGFGKRNSEALRLRSGSLKGKPLEICYCHTPPRYLYGYETAVRKNFPIQLYGLVVNKFMRMYDYSAAQRVDYFIANSKNVQARIKKFYKRDSVVIYPPVELDLGGRSHFAEASRDGLLSKNYYLVVARIVGAKGLEMAVEAANRLKVPLKIAGSPAGFSRIYQDLKKRAGDNIEFLGYVSDEELIKLYMQAKAFLALARDEDFGITPVEAMQAGTPVIAYKGGGYLETVIGGKTGIFFEDYTVDGLVEAITKLDKHWLKSEDCRKQGQKFSKPRFKREILEFVNSVVRK